MWISILGAALLAAGGAGGNKVDSAEVAEAADATRAGHREESAVEDHRVVARFEPPPAATGKRPSTWSGTGRTWAWVGAAGLGLAGAVIGYHYWADSEVPKDRVISLRDR